MVTVYTKPACPQCVQTKAVMANVGIEFREIDLTKNPAAMQRVMEMGFRSAPVVVVDDQSWAGFQRGRIEAMAPADDIWG